MMTPDRWTDAQGRELPTRSCPRCRHVIDGWALPSVLSALGILFSK